MLATPLKEQDAVEATFPQATLGECAKLVWYGFQWSVIMTKIFFGALMNHGNRILPLSAYKMARGNKASLAILKRLYFTAPKAYEIITGHFYQLDISGYKITTLYRHSGGKMHLFVYWCNDLGRLLFLLRQLNDGPETYRRSVQWGSDAALKEIARQIIDLKKPDLLRKVLDWPTLFSTISVDKEVEEGILSFLIPDQVSCFKWYVNYRALKQRLEPEMQCEVSPYILTRPDVKAPFFPLWFIAGYPNVVQWSLQPQSGSGLYEMLAEEAVLDCYQLRTLVNTYDESAAMLNGYYDLSIVSVPRVAEASI